MMNVIDQAVANRYALYHGDSVEITKEIPDNSIHYTIFSPPFSQLYVYSNSDRDMGNCKGDEEFYNHFEYLAKELYRITMPGRLLSFTVWFTSYEIKRWCYWIKRFSCAHA